MTRSSLSAQLLLLALALLAACADRGGSTDEVIEEPAEDVYESVSDSVQRPLEEAAEVETLLEDRRDAMDRALDEATEN